MKWKWHSRWAAMQNLWDGVAATSSHFPSKLLNQIGARTLQCMKIENGKINKMSIRWFAALFEQRSGNGLYGVGCSCVRWTENMAFAEVICCLLWRRQKSAYRIDIHCVRMGMELGARTEEIETPEMKSFQFNSWMRDVKMTLDAVASAYICFIQRKKQRSTHIHHPSCEQRLAHAFLLKCLKPFFRPSSVNRSESNVCVCVGDFHM